MHGMMFGSQDHIVRASIFGSSDDVVLQQAASSFEQNLYWSSNEEGATGSTAMTNENALPEVAFWNLVKKERYLKIALEFWKILRLFSGIF